MKKTPNPNRLPENLKAMYGMYGESSGIALRRLWNLRQYAMLAEVHLHDALLKQAETLNLKNALDDVVSTLAKDSAAQHSDLADLLEGNWLLLLFVINLIAMEGVWVGEMQSPELTFRRACDVAEELIKSMEPKPKENIGEGPNSSVIVPVGQIFSDNEARYQWTTAIMFLTLAQNTGELGAPSIDIYSEKRQASIQSVPHPSGNLGVSAPKGSH